ncbi:MAG: hypothetical protein HDS28_03775 [Bacteroides sp.]|nr:hypothetical protein [Bacteroides sp.]
MNYSDQQLTTIQKLASVYLTVSDIAAMLEVAPDILRDDIRDKSHPASIAYRKGKLHTKLALHSQEVKLASIGSPLALENARRNLLDMEDDE